MPSGYGAPLGSPTAKLLDLLGRHGYRPAHVHLMVEAPEHRLLTTQINIAGDTYIDDDAAFATRDGLIVDVVKVEDPKEIARRKLEGAFSLIRFDIKIQPTTRCATAVDNTTSCYDVHSVGARQWRPALVPYKYG